MPELPDITVYVEALERTVGGRTLERVRVVSPSLLRTWDPPVSALTNRQVLGVCHIGKRIVFRFEDDLYAIVHLMIAGRFKWKLEHAAVISKKGAHAAFDFEHGTLILTEAGTKKRAGLWVLRGAEAVAAQDRGGIDPLSATFDEFRDALVRENRTMKRALTDPRILSGIGNAYSDEILWRAPCQTGGKLLADRALSRLLGEDWPKSLEELEEMGRV